MEGGIRYSNTGVHIIPAYRSNVICNVTIGFLKLSAQRALLGNVTPNLRAVCLNYKDYVIEIIFFYDKGISVKWKLDT